MSTKIYDAYRIPKSEFKDKFITDVLYDLKQETIDRFFESDDLLKGIHQQLLIWVKKNKTEKEFESFVESNYIPDWELYDYMQECEQQTTKSLYYFDIDFDCSVFEDEGYWYLKFYANQRWQWDLLKKWEDEFDWFEDFHYQNQTDPPEDIPYDEYKKRDDKWDELCKGEYNYKNGLHYHFMDSYIFRHDIIWNRDRELPYDFNGLKLNEKGKITDKSNKHIEK